MPELGYHIVRAEWGHGYATEAALACRDWFFANTTRDRLVSIVWPPNTASRRVSEKVHARMREFVWEKSGTAECLLRDAALGSAPVDLNYIDWRRAAFDSVWRSAYYARSVSAVSHVSDHVHVWPCPLSGRPSLSCRRASFPSPAWRA